MDFFSKRNRILASIPGNIEEKLIVGMVTGAFEELAAEEKQKEELREKEMELLDLMLKV